MAKRWPGTTAVIEICKLICKSITDASDCPDGSNIRLSISLPETCRDYLSESGCRITRSHFRVRTAMRIWLTGQRQKQKGSEHVNGGKNSHGAQLICCKNGAVSLHKNSMSRLCRRNTHWTLRFFLTCCHRIKNTIVCNRRALVTDTLSQEQSRPQYLLPWDSLLVPTLIICYFKVLEAEQRNYFDKFFLHFGTSVKLNSRNILSCSRCCKPR